MSDKDMYLVAVRGEDGEWERNFSHPKPDLLRGMAEMIAYDLHFMGWKKDRFDAMLEEEIDRMPERVASWEK